MPSRIEKRTTLVATVGTLYLGILIAPALAQSGPSAPPSFGEFSGSQKQSVGITSTDVLRRYLDSLSARHNFPAPSQSLISRADLAQYFLKIMAALSVLPTDKLSDADYQDIGLLSDEFEEVIRVVKGRLALQAFKNELPAQQASNEPLRAEVQSNSARLKILERTQISGDFTFAPQADSGKGVRDSTATNLRGRINFTTKVHEAKPEDKMGDGILFTRFTAASGRFFPRNKYLLSPENGLVDSVASPFNSGPNEVQVPDLFINNNNSNSTRPTVSMEQAYYSQDIRFNPKLKANYKVGLIYMGNMFDTNNYANNETMQFLNTSFINSISWRPNFVGPSTVFSLQRSFLRDKLFLRGTAGMTTLTDRDFFGNAGWNYELQAGHNFKNKEGNLRVGFWHFNMRGGSAIPFVRPVDLVGTSVLAQIPGGVTTGSRPAGMYLNFDQKIWKNIGIWGRYAMNDKQIGEVFLGGLLSSRANWSSGLEIPMSIFTKKRPDDVFGIAYGQIAPYSREAVTPATPAFLVVNGIPSTNLQQVNQNLALINPGPHHRNEKILEAYYRYQLNKNVSISPDVQYYWSPGGTGPQPGIFVLGSRLTVSF